MMKKFRYSGDFSLNDFRGYEFYKEESCNIIEKPEDYPCDDAVFIAETANLQNSPIPGTHQSGDKSGYCQAPTGKEKGAYILPGPLVKTKPQSCQEIEQYQGLGKRLGTQFKSCNLN